MINHRKMLTKQRSIGCNSIALLLVAVLTSTTLLAHAQSKSHSGGSKADAFHRKNRDLYSGWEMYQSSKSMGSNRLLLCAGGLKIVNSLMSLVYWPKTSQLVMINNSNHKYFLSTKEKFPHYIKLLGFDIFTTGSKDIKYSEWKKLDNEKIAGMDAVLYQRKAINLAADAERKEQTWVSKSISLPETLYNVYSEVSGRPDSCHFGFPMRSKVISNIPPEGYRVRVDFNTEEVTEKQFSPNDFLPPKGYLLVKEFSEFLLNDSESQSFKSVGSSRKNSENKLETAVSEFKLKAEAAKAKRQSEGSKTNK